MKISSFSTLLFTLLLVSCNPNTEEKSTQPKGRAEFDLARLKDPATGKIPEGMRMKELAFAATLL